jgi:FKBP-type peptidyl-prolyl cis-trans isomerase FkpA
MTLIRRPRLLLLLALLPLAPVPALADGGTADVAEMPEHLVVRDIKIGDGAEAQVGNMIEVQYTGWIYDARAQDLHGKQFDSSAGRGPFSFMLGVGSVIKGWDRGVVGMKVGGKRTLIIPPNIAYGQRGAGQDIPPGSTLIFDIELVKVE